MSAAGYAAVEGQLQSLWRKSLLGTFPKKKKRRKKKKRERKKKSWGSSQSAPGRVQTPSCPRQKFSKPPKKKLKNEHPPFPAIPDPNAGTGRRSYDYSPHSPASGEPPALPLARYGPLAGGDFQRFQSGTRPSPPGNAKRRQMVYEPGYIFMSWAYRGHPTGSPWQGWLGWLVGARPLGAGPVFGDLCHVRSRGPR